MDKFQSGGIFRSMVYRPLPMAPSPDMSQVTNVPGIGGSPVKAEEPETIPKEIIKDLLGKGITNDVMQFKEEVDGAYNAYANLSDLEKNTQYGRHLRSVMKGDFAKLNNLQRNKELFEKGLSTMSANQAESDYAITTNGVIVKDNETGLVGEVSHNEFATKYRDSGRYKMLTNAELINEREYNKNLTFDTRSLTALTTSIGITKVKEEVLKVLDKIGKQSNSNSQQILSYGSPSRASEGALALLANGVQGFYKEGLSTSTESNAENMTLAIETMWINLSDNAKSLLKARAVAQGAQGADIEKQARQDAISILNPSYDVTSSQSYTVDFEGGMLTALNKKNGGGEDGEGPLGEKGYFSETVSGSGDPRVLEIQNGTELLSVIGNTAGSIQDRGEFVQPGSMLTDIQSLNSMANMSYAYMGNSLLTNKQLQDVMYNGKDMALVEVPVKNEGQYEVPDLETNKKYQKVMKDIIDAKTKNPNITAVALQTIIRNHGMNPVNVNGEIKPQVKTKYFLATDATASSAVLKNADDTSKLRKVGKDARKQYINYYLKGKGNTTGNGDNIIGRNSFDRWFSTTDLFGRDVYEGVVFIPTAAHPLDMKNRALRADGKNSLTAKENLNSRNVSSVSNPTGHNVRKEDFERPDPTNKYKND